MDENAIKVRKLLRQQAAIANFGSFALRQNDLLKVLTEAARVCANTLNAPFSKICRYRPAEHDLLIEAGFGWQDGVVGHVVSRADTTSPQGRAFVSGKPSICNELVKDGDFELPSFYAKHGVVSTIDVLIKGDGQPYGVLEVDNNNPQEYDRHDVDFLTGFANVLAEAVATSVRTALLQTTIAEMGVLVEEKDRLIVQKNVLAEELQHRVRNNLQLVYGMLSKQIDDTADAPEKRGLRAIARRVSTLAQVYDNLLGSEMTRTTDFGAYVKSLCNSLAEIQGVPDGTIILTCESDPLLIDLDTVTALGIIVTELVTNSYDHAFPSGKGTTAVEVRRVAGSVTTAIMTIRDDGTGFVPDPGSKRHGLGLVRRLAEQIRGSASVDSNHGTVWSITFPVATADP